VQDEEGKQFHAIAVSGGYELDNIDERTPSSYDENWFLRQNINNTSSMSLNVCVIHHITTAIT
jgi:hypothetical protein